MDLLQNIPDAQRPALRRAIHDFAISWESMWTVLHVEPDMRNRLHWQNLKIWSEIHKDAMAKLAGVGVGIFTTAVLDTHIAMAVREMARIDALRGEAATDNEIKLHN